MSDEFSRTDVVDKAVSNIQKAQAHQKRNYDKRCNPVGFKVGDTCLSQGNLFQPPKSEFI